MSALAQSENTAKRNPHYKPLPSSMVRGDGPPLRLETRAEVKAYLEKHLTPIEFGPKGQPLYAHEDLIKLNVIFRGEEIW